MAPVRVESTFARLSVSLIETDSPSAALLVGEGAKLTASVSNTKNILLNEEQLQCCGRARAA